MKTILRRVGLLESKLAPQGDAASSRVAGLLRERRRRRLDEESGQPFEDGVRDSGSPAYVARLSVAETLRLCRRRRIERYRAAAGEKY